MGISINCITSISKPYWWITSSLKNEPQGEFPYWKNIFGIFAYRRFKNWHKNSRRLFFAVRAFLWLLNFVVVFFCFYFIAISSSKYIYTFVSFAIFGFCDYKYINKSKTTLNWHWTRMKNRNNFCVVLGYVLRFIPFFCLLLFDLVCESRGHFISWPQLKCSTFNWNRS